MALSTRLAGPRDRWVPTCTIAKLSASMPEDDLAAFAKALADENVTASYLARAMRDEGYHVGDTTIRRHRRGDCRCHVSA